MPWPLSSLGFSRRVQLNLAFKLITTSVEKGLKFVLLMAATRTLGKEEWGRYAWAYTLTLCLVQLTDFGLGTYLTREIAREGRGAGRLYGAALGLKVFLGVLYLSFLSALTFSVIREPAYKVLIMALGLANLSQSFTELFARVFQGFQRLEFEMVLVGTSAALSVGAGLTVLALGGRVVGFTLALTTLSVPVAVSGGLVVFWNFFRVSPLWDGPYWLALFKDVGPIGGAAILSTAYFRVGILLAGMFLNERATALYGTAMQVLEVARILPAVVMAALFPFVSMRLHDTRAQRSGVALLAAAGLLVGGLCLAFPGWIMRTMCGPEFLEAAPLLRILGLAMPFMMVNFALTHYLIAYGLQKKYLGFCLLLLSLSVGLNSVLISFLGVTGPAWSTLATEFALTALCALGLWRERAGRRGTLALAG
jgi:O-antigen/teichoic acid export membrane protein